MTALVVMQGDACNIPLPNDEADAVVTDPPYGTEGKSGGYGRRQLGARTIAGDGDLSTFEASLPEIMRVLKPNSWFVFFIGADTRRQAERMVEAAGFTYYGDVVWDKRSPGMGAGIRYQHEYALAYMKGEAVLNGTILSLLRAPRTVFARPEHPHEKPTSVMRELVRFASAPGNLVVDPFMGSGRTGVACVELGREFFGIDVEMQWVELAERRLGSAQPMLELGDEPDLLTLGL